MSIGAPAREAVLRIGEVVAVEGNKIYVLVDRKKNLSHMFLDGDIVTNISVNSYLEIRKGFLSIIGRVEAERIEEYPRQPHADSREALDKSKRILTLSLTGFIDEQGSFSGGTRELPLIGNEAFLLTRKQLERVHDLVGNSDLFITIGTLFGDDLELRLPVDGLFNSHIAIFGNTGSGKSNTLASLYQELVAVLHRRNPVEYKAQTRFVLFDFNGEFAHDKCITHEKKAYTLSTRLSTGDRLPLEEEGLLEIEVLTILADATERTQKPFLVRALKLLKRMRQPTEGTSTEYFRNMLRRVVKETLQMTDKNKAYLLIDYFRQILPLEDENGNAVDLYSDLEWYNQGNEFTLRPNRSAYLHQHPERIADTTLYKHVERANFSAELMSDLIATLYLQLILDVLANRAQNEHIAPVINRLIRKRTDIEKLFDWSQATPFWQSNFVVINLEDVNLDMRKTIPLLLSKRLYNEHKKSEQDSTLTLIIDEAHNILSTESFREAESWKDYRLETFEEIIKEGRKFGVFVTIASQRPNDISPTITSQAHNYFIHRLINERDLKTIESAVSYIDRVTEESIPTLPTGTCVFSGVAGTVPLKINVRPLPESHRPDSATRKFSTIVPTSIQP